MVKSWKIWNIWKNPGKILVLSQILIMKCAATQFPELQCNGARRLFDVPTALSQSLASEPGKPGVVQGWKGVQ